MLVLVHLLLFVCANKRLAARAQVTVTAFTVILLVNFLAEVRESKLAQVRVG